MSDHRQAKFLSINQSFATTSVKYCKEISISSGHFCLALSPTNLHFLSSKQDLKRDVLACCKRIKKNKCNQFHMLLQTQVLETGLNRLRTQLQTKNTQFKGDIYTVFQICHQNQYLAEKKNGQPE